MRMKSAIKADELDKFDALEKNLNDKLEALARVRVTHGRALMTRRSSLYQSYLAIRGEQAHPD